MPTLLDGFRGTKLGALRTRFWQYVHEDGRDHDLPVDQCWEWRGATAQGNPVVSLNGKLIPARRVAYALEVKDYDANLHVIATCYSPLCVNPAHLSLVERRPENNVVDDLKKAAVQAVSAAVWQHKTLPQVSTRPCAKCGQPAADYHHHLGYEPEHWLDVLPLCRRCHRKAEWKVIKERGPVYYCA